MPLTLVHGLLVQMLSGGEDVSFLFPDVVKNVVSKNLELKKLVYHFLVHYAESQVIAGAVAATGSFFKAQGGILQHSVVLTTRWCRRSSRCCR